MPIVNHNLEQNIQANGGTSNILRMYDQDGREYLSSFFLPPDFDVTTLVSNKIAEFNVQLAESEFEQIVGAD